MDLAKLFAQSEQKPIDMEVTDLDSATKVAKEIANIGEKLSNYAMAYEAELALLEEQMKGVKSKYDAIMLPLQAELATYNEKLVKYHRSTLENANPKEQESLKSIKLPYGVTLTSRAQADKLNIIDQDKYVAYAESNDLIKVKRDVEWAKLKKLLDVREDGTVINKNTGEIVDFIQVEKQERTFDVKWD